MNARVFLGLTVLVVFALLLTACGAALPTTYGSAATEAPPDMWVEETEAPPQLATQEPLEAPTEAPPPDSGPAPYVPPLPPSSAAAVSQSAGDGLPSFVYQPNRLIVKDAELRLLVADTDVALDGLTQTVADCGGYIISSRVWYQDWLGQNHKYATVTIGVPVDQFERAMRLLRGLAVQVLDETASGEDVTDEYVDLQSRLGNLQATRDRIREFLAQTTNVTEALQVNEQLATIEAEIEQVEGRMNYLFDRSAYSTITVQMEPELPPATPTPTPTPTPTATPTPTPTPVPPWSPTQTAREAGSALGSVLRVLVELTLWFLILVVPMVAPPIVIIWLLARLSRRRRRRPTSARSEG